MEATPLPHSFQLLSAGTEDLCQGMAGLAWVGAQLRDQRASTLPLPAVAGDCGPPDTPSRGHPPWFMHTASSTHSSHSTPWDWRLSCSFMPQTL